MTRYMYSDGGLVWLTIQEISQFIIFNAILFLFLTNVDFIFFIGEPMYLSMHLMQNFNISTDESIQDLVKKLADGSLILYDLHRYRLYVPEQPLRIMQPRNTGKN